MAMVALGAVAIAAMLHRAPRAPVAPAAAHGAIPVADYSGQRGALVDEIVFTQETDIGKVTELIGAGSHQVFAQPISTIATFRGLRDSARTAYDFSYGVSVELSTNPAGPKFTDGRVNPFHVREIREALNWLVDRRYIVDELYGGLAVPRYLPLNTSLPDYARLAGVARAIEMNYRPDPERARRVITTEMEKLGATLQQGRWWHDGVPLRIVLLIRTEDERKRVGDYIANLLEDVGFEVDRQYRNAEEAARIWIAGDPKAGAWHLYTGGWVVTVIDRDQADQFSAYYTPRGRPEPLWQVYQPDPELDDIADRLSRRDYATWDERQELMARGLDLAMRDSCRIWLVDQLAFSPRAREVEMAMDLVAGVAGSSLWPYTVRYAGHTGGRMVFAVPNLLTQPWNPVDGSTWLYDRMIWRGLDDSVLLPDPFTGLYWPQRITAAQVTVQQDVPVIQTHDWLTVDRVAEIVVPADTWIAWDAEAARFVTAAERFPEGVKARTRTLIRYEPKFLERHWHDGTQVSLADVVLPWILTFERAATNSPLFDESYVPAFEVFEKHFRGWRIVSRDPLEIEIYSDQIYPDAEWIAAARAPSATPWHTLALGIAAERAGELAFSANKADRAKVEWMSFVAGPSLAYLEQHMSAATGPDAVPYAATLGPLMRPGEAEARFTALREWYAARQHFWVSDGPFYLHSVHPIERSVVLRRNPEFTDPSDKWLRFTRAEVPNLDLTGPMVVTAGDAAKFDLRITFDGKPYPEDGIESARYLLFGGDGALVREDEAAHDNGEHWRIELDAATLAKLGTGANSLEVAVTSRRVALPTFVSHAFATVPSGEAER